MDIIFLRGLQIETIVGIYEWERQTKQTVLLDLEMGANIREAALHDKIENTLDYEAVSQCTIAYIKECQFLLVETLAEGVADLLLRKFNLPWIRLTLTKRNAICAASDVGVTIERTNSRC
ncbi:MAG: dihydroneopterin aldolase [Parachlamydiaceae bacterium]|nr:dihydroneopterin aldolase [Parachlamydiaceae bacterium]